MRDPGVPEAVLRGETVPPEFQLDLLVGQERSLEPEDPVVNVFHADRPAPVFRREEAAKVIDAGTVGEVVQDGDVLLAVLLPAMLRRDGEARPVVAPARLMDDPDAGRLGLAAARPGFAVRAVERELVGPVEVARAAGPASWAFEQAVLQREAVELVREVLVRQDQEAYPAVTVAAQVLADHVLAILPRVGVVFIFEELADPPQFVVAGRLHFVAPQAGPEGRLRH